VPIARAGVLTSVRSDLSAVVYLPSQIHRTVFISIGRVELWPLSPA
jgi:hypothetical protein